MERSAATSTRCTVCGGDSASGQRGCSCEDGGTWGRAFDIGSYREGFADALRWVLNVFNLDTEDEDELNRVLLGGACEGSRVR